MVMHRRRAESLNVRVECFHFELFEWKSTCLDAFSQHACQIVDYKCYVRRWIGHESYAASWYDDRTEKKMTPTRDSNHAPSAIRADVLSQLDQKGHSVLGSFQILTISYDKRKRLDVNL